MIILIFFLISLIFNFILFKWINLIIFILLFFLILSLFIYFKYIYIHYKNDKNYIKIIKSLSITLLFLYFTLIFPWQLIGWAFLIEKFWWYYQIFNFLSYISFFLTPMFLIFYNLVLLKNKDFNKVSKINFFITIFFSMLIIISYIFLIFEKMN